MKSLKQILIIVAIAVAAFPGCSLNHQSSRFASCESVQHCGCYRCQQLQRCEHVSDTNGRPCACGAGCSQQVQIGSTVALPENAAFSVSTPDDQGEGNQSFEASPPPARVDVQPANIEEVEPPIESINLSSVQRSTDAQSSSRSNYDSRDEETFSSPQSSFSDVSERMFDEKSDWNVPPSSKTESETPRTEYPVNESSPMPIKATPIGVPLKRSESKDRVAFKKLASRSLESKSGGTKHADRLVLNARPVGKSSPAIVPAGRSTAAFSIPPIESRLSRDMRRNELRFTPSTSPQPMSEIVVDDVPKSVEPEKDEQLQELVQQQYASVEVESKTSKRVLLRAFPLPRNRQAGVQARIVPPQSQLQYERSRSQIADHHLIPKLAKPFRPLKDRTEDSYAAQSSAESKADESWHERTARVPAKEEASLAPWRQR